MNRREAIVAAACAVLAKPLCATADVVKGWGASERRASMPCPLCCSKRVFEYRIELPDPPCTHYCRNCLAQWYQPASGRLHVYCVEPDTWVRVGVKWNPEQQRPIFNVNGEDMPIKDHEPPAQVLEPIMATKAQCTPLEIDTIRRW